MEFLSPVLVLPGTQGARVNHSRRW